MGQLSLFKKNLGTWSPSGFPVDLTKANDTFTNLPGTKIAQTHSIAFDFYVFFSVCILSVYSPCKLAKHSHLLIKQWIG